MRTQPHNPLRINAGRVLSRSALWGLAMALLFLAGTGPGWAGESEPLSEAETVEYQLKAGFLFNFAKFVQWPTTNSTGTDTARTNEFRVGIVDASGAHAAVSNALSGKMFKEQKLVVERVDTPAAAARCDMLFVTQNPGRTAKEILEHVAAEPVLTVGETPEFAVNGGCINLVRHAQKLRFEVNLEAAAAAGLKVSSQLSAMAIVVKTQKESK